MKRFAPTFFLVLLSFFSIHLFSQSPSIAVKSGKFQVAKTAINSNWDIKPVLDKLGGDYRIYKGYNIVYTYDQYGIVVFEKKENESSSGKMLEFQIHFELPEANNVTPKNTFNGTISVEKLKVSKSLSAEKMFSTLRKYKKGDSYSDHNYRMSYKGLYIYFQFNASEQSLQKISIGPDRNK